MNKKWKKKLTKKYAKDIKLIKINGYYTYECTAFKMKVAK